MSNVCSNCNKSVEKLNECLIETCSAKVCDDCYRENKSRCSTCLDIGCLRCKCIAKDEFVLLCPDCDRDICIQCCSVVWNQSGEAVCIDCISKFQISCEKCGFKIDGDEYYQTKGVLCIDEVKCKCGQGYDLVDKE